MIVVSPWRSTIVTRATAEVVTESGKTGFTWTCYALVIEVPSLRSLGGWSATRRMAGRAAGPARIVIPVAKSLGLYRERPGADVPKAGEERSNRGARDTAICSKPTTMPYGD